MRVVIGGFSHESNTFNPTQMTLAEFRPVFGEAVLNMLQPGGRGPLHGIYDVLCQAEAEIIPTVFARAVPGGIVARDVFDTVTGELYQRIRDAGDIDGVCLHLHGSMTVDGIGDAEGAILREVRAIVGPEVMITTSLDMHAMVTSAMVNHADGFAGYRTAPHVDAYETGVRAARLLVDALNGGYQLAMAAVGLPLLVSGEQSETEKYPMNRLIKVLEQTDERAGILDTSYFLGFPWADVPHNFASALVVAKVDPDLAETVAVELAEEFWGYHEEFRFTTEAYPIEEALEVANSHPGGLVCIADCGDNPGAGGSENITSPLQFMLTNGQKRTLFGAIADPASYQRCAVKGVGKFVHLELGRLSIAPDSPGLPVEGEVICLGMLGRVEAAVVKIQGVDVVVSAERAMMLDPEELRVLGVDLADYDVLVLKSGYLDPQYEVVADKGLLGLTPGFTNQIFRDLQYTKVPRPIYPLDQGFAYNPQDYIL